jgi:hypothetical protein
MDWLYPLSGFVVGGIVGLTGMGGGSLKTPLLILLFGVHPLTAVGTDLLYAAVTKTAGTAIHAKKGNVEWRVAAVLATGSVPASVPYYLDAVPAADAEPNHHVDHLHLDRGCTDLRGHGDLLSPRHPEFCLGPCGQPDETQYSGPITVVFGAVLGVLVSLCSVGAKRSSISCAGSAP